MYGNCDKLLQSRATHTDENNHRAVGKNRALENMDKSQNLLQSCRILLTRRDQRHPG